MSDETPVNKKQTRQRRISKRFRDRMMSGLADPDWKSAETDQADENAEHPNQSAQPDS
ncbi:MAG: hypothetical protein AAGC81_05960 [Pseudomonadota bacterium]